MGYNTLESARNRVGDEITQENIDDAKSFIDIWSDYRWEETNITEILSGKGNSHWLELYSPIISVSSFKIDDTAQTEDTDFEIRKGEGSIYCNSALPLGNDNISITYKYGFTESSNLSFYSKTINTVKFVEAALALYLHKNPLLMSSVKIEGISIAFDDFQLEKLLVRIPKVPNFGAIS